MEPNEPKPRRRSIVGPVVLVLLGVLFLLNNMGLVDWNVWDLMWRLWPVWLIAVGLDILLGRKSHWASWVILSVVLVLGIGAVVLGANGALGGSTGEPVAIHESVSGAARANVKISAAVGSLRVTGLSGGDKLVEGNVNPLNGEDVKQDFRVKDGTAFYNLSSKGFSGIPFFNSRKNEHASWEVALSDQLPLTVDIRAGVGKSEIDLSNVKLTDGNIETGVGETIITTPRTGKFNLTVNTGVGKVTIHVPDGMAYRVKAKQGIGAIEVDGANEKKDGYYVSQNYESAENRVDIDVSGGIGKVEVLTGR